MFLNQGWFCPPPPAQKTFGNVCRTFRLSQLGRGCADIMWGEAGVSATPGQPPPPPPWQRSIWPWMKESLYGWTPVHTHTLSIRPGLRNGYHKIRQVDWNPEQTVQRLPLPCYHKSLKSHRWRAPGSLCRFPGSHLLNLSSPQRIFFTEALQENGRRAFIQNIHAEQV